MHGSPASTLMLQRCTPPKIIQLTRLNTAGSRIHAAAGQRTVCARSPAHHGRQAYSQHGDRRPTDAGRHLPGLWPDRSSCRSAQACPVSSCSPSGPGHRLQSVRWQQRMQGSLRHPAWDPPCKGLTRGSTATAVRQHHLQGALQEAGVLCTSSWVMSSGLHETHVTAER